MSSPFEKPNPFLNPADDEEGALPEVESSSAWQAFSERMKRERLQRRQALIALVLEYFGVALTASVASSFGMEEGTFVIALKAALVGGVCGGGFCVVAAMLAVTGAARPMLPAYARAALPATPEPRGIPIIFPIAIVGALAGTYLFTVMGAGVGASKAGAGDGSEALRGLLGGILGLVPVGFWWLHVRQRDGKSIRPVLVVLISLLLLSGVAGTIGFVSGALKPGYSYSSLRDRGHDRYRSGDLDGAVSDFSKAIALEPRNPYAYWERCLALIKQGKDAEAERDYQRCLELKPGDEAELERQFQEAIEQRQRR